MGGYTINLSVDDMGVVLKSLFYMTLRYDGEDPSFIKRATALRASLLKGLEYSNGLIEV